MIIEVCVDSLRSAQNAEKGGADRIELCQDLSLGGTTPSYGLILLTLQNLSLPVMVMIRPRGGDFCYNREEFSCMIEDIRLMKKLGVSGIVTGILTEDGEIDKKRMQHLIEEAEGMDITFHRAFDMTGDLFRALCDLEELGIRRVLTSGGRASALQGRDILKELVCRSRRVDIMAGCGVNASNAVSLAEIGITELHLSGRQFLPSKMRFRNPQVSMGSSSHEYLLEETAEKNIADLRKIFPKSSA